MAEVMIQEKEDAAAWLSTLHSEELMQEAAVPKKIVAEDFFFFFKYSEPHYSRIYAVMLLTVC